MGFPAGACLSGEEEPKVRCLVAPGLRVHRLPSTTGE